jgi:DNA (cytosine-5)-methyltransferase 1
MKHLDLFSGIGGFALAAEWVWGDEYENVGHSEVEPYACKVYHQHFNSRCLGDITKIEWEEGQADLITGGFPCQPHSHAGKRKGSADERDLWGECVRAVSRVRPRLALFENVPGLFTSDGGRFFNRILSDLYKIGYDAEWTIISASSVGAPHRRDRVWIVAYPQIGDAGGEAGKLREAKWRPGRALHGEPGRTGAEGNVADTQRNGLGSGLRKGGSGGKRRGRSGNEGSEISNADTFPDPRGHGRETGGERSVTDQTPHITRRDAPAGDWWAVEPNVGRVADGIPSRVDRLKGLGNAIVPQCAEVILQQIKERGLR